MMATRLSSLKCDASMAASQMLPSCCSPSPMMQNTVCLLAVELAGQRHADRDAEALPKRSAGDLDPRQLQPVRMSLEWRIELAQSNDVFDGEVSGEAKAEVQSGSFMSGRPDDAVALLPFRIVGIVVGDL